MTSSFFSHTSRKNRESSQVNNLELSVRVRKVYVRNLHDADQVFASLSDYLREKTEKLLGLCRVLCKLRQSNRDVCDLE